ncbi:hypothetical protein MKX01_012079 [Papaver californicum]|nr:hypothetical protein MKX01_012079 [Papaver californicum]
MKTKKKIGQKKSSSGGDGIQVEIVFEILSRLPVKSVMRFKCDDKYFIDLYHTRSKLRPCLVLFVPIHQKFNITPGTTYTLCRRYQANLLIADLCEGVGRVAEGVTAVPHNVRKTTSIKYDKVIHEKRVCYDGILKPVNGLICFKLTPWMSTTLMRKGDHADPKYQFGFDPATKEHKVICLWKSEIGFYPRRDSDPVYVGCDESFFHPNGSVYVNGSIYWITHQLRYHGEKVSVAFDVGTEKFRTILVPKFITDQFLYDKEYMDIFNSSKDLLELSNRVALFCRIPSGYTIKLWILDCHDNNNKDISARRTASCNLNWTERTIELPFQWDNKRRVVIHGIPGTDEILIETYEGRTYIKCLSLVSYSWRSMTFRKVESDEPNYLNSPGGFRKRGVNMCSTITESLFPVQKKISRRRQGR